MAHTKKPTGIRKEGAALLMALFGYSVVGCNSDPEGGDPSPDIPSDVPFEEADIIGKTLAQALKEVSGDTRKKVRYTITLSKDEYSAPAILEYPGRIIEIMLKGDAPNRTVTLSRAGSFTIKEQATLTLEDITLKGIGIEGGVLNASSLVRVDGGTFVMNAGSVITGNVFYGSDACGGGVQVLAKGPAR